MNKASIFMGASWIGLGGLAFALAGLAFEGSNAVFLSGWAVVALSNFVMLATRKADEYTLGLWNAGASVAFGAMLVLFFALPAFEGAYDGLTGAEKKQDIPASFVPVLAIMTFNIGLFVKRLVGDGS